MPSANSEGFPLNLDLAILHAISSFGGVSSVLDLVVGVFRDNYLVKLVPFMAMFWALWFKIPDRNKNREKLILLLFGVVIAVVANRIFSEIMPFRARPFTVADIGIRPPHWAVPTADDKHFSSFPSDHAALLFALLGGFWFVSRTASLLLSILAACVLLARIYFGLHFPSDIVVGSLIGIGAAVLANRISFLRRLAAFAYNAEQRAPAYFYGAMFVCTYEIGNLFEQVRALAIQAASLIGNTFHLHLWA